MVSMALQTTERRNSKPGIAVDAGCRDVQKEYGGAVRFHGERGVRAEFRVVVVEIDEVMSRVKNGLCRIRVCPLSYCMTCMSITGSHK